MPRYIVKLKDSYLEWSTVVDAPVTKGMSLEDFKIYYRNEYGNEGMQGLPARLIRVEDTGTSSQLDSNLKETIGGNRAGKDETCLTEDQIYAFYCARQAEGEAPEGSQDSGGSDDSH